MLVGTLESHRAYTYAEVGRTATLSIIVFRLPRLTEPVFSNASRRALPISSSLVSSYSKRMLPTTGARPLRTSPHLACRLECNAACHWQPDAQ